MRSSIVLCAVGLLHGPAAGLPGSGGLGGTVGVTASDLRSRGPCIHAEARRRVQRRALERRSLLGLPELGSPPPFAFWPQAGELGEDLFIGSYVDLDPGAGVLDWNCTDHAADGHRGSDAEIRTFGEQAIGVPVFAAQDGIVLDARDGFPDMNVSGSLDAGNYVILGHAGGLDTWYFHLKNGSVLPSIGQMVRAGEEIGRTASSGNSFAPHLHLEVQQSLVPVEPFAGPCNPVPSLWSSQEPFLGALYADDFAVSRTVPSASPYPFDPPRDGQWVTSDPVIYFWILSHNLPANTLWRVRFLRPDATTALDSGDQPFNNPPFVFAWFWFQWDVPDMHSIPGTWTLVLDFNGQNMVTAPIEVKTAFVPGFNRPPEPITARIEPARPMASDVLVCRIGGDRVLDDLDWDIVRYEYRWTVDGATVRTVTSAGRSDALPRDTAHAGQTVACEVTPGDGLASGAAVIAEARIRWPLRRFPRGSFAPR